MGTPYHSFSIFSSPYLFQVLGGEHGFMMVWIVRLVYINQTLAMGLDAAYSIRLIPVSLPSLLKGLALNTNVLRPQNVQRREAENAGKTSKNLRSETYLQETSVAANFGDISDTNEQEGLVVKHPPVELCIRAVPGCRICGCPSRIMMNMELV